MSQSSKMCLFSEVIPQNPSNVIKSLLEKCDPNVPTFVTRYREAWQEWKKYFEEGDDSYTNDSADIVYKKHSFDEIPQLFLPEGMLSIDPLGNPWATKITKAVLQRIDSKLHNGYISNGLTIRFGYHDIYEDWDPEEMTLYGHAQVSCSFRSYGCPTDVGDFGMQVFSLPEVIEVRSELEGIIGPMKGCFYFVG